jgi:hypothetical protein
MVRKDPALDTDRAHYYSQFWIEVAAGRPIGHGSPATDEEDIEPEETDFASLLSAPPMAVPRVEPKPKPRAAERKETGRSLSSLADLANIADLMSQSAQMEDESGPDIEAGVGEGAESGMTTNFDLDELPVRAHADALDDEVEEDLDDFEEEDEEEDDDWGGSRRSKPKKPPRRDRRSF